MRELRIRMRRIVPVMVALGFVIGVSAETFGNGGEGPDRREELLLGPATVGTVTITPVGLPSETGINVTFTGRCGPDAEVTIVFPPLPFVFNLVTPQEIIEHGRLENAGTVVPACYADLEARQGVSADLVLFNVTQFTNLGSSIEAQVVAVASIPR